MKRVRIPVAALAAAACLLACDLTDPDPDHTIRLLPDKVVLRTGDAMPVGVDVRTLDGRKVDDVTPTWSVANTAVASVDGSGQVTAHSTGETTLTARHGGAQTTIPVVVVAEQLAFTRSGQSASGLYVVSPDGSGEALLTGLSAPAGLRLAAWSPDGSRLAIVDDRLPPTGPGELYLLPGYPSAHAELLADSVQTFAPNRLSWSPDGTRVVTTRIASGSKEIWVIHEDGGATRLTQNDRIDAAPAWSPAGDRIAYESVHDGNSEIHVVGPDGGGDVNVSVHEATDEGPVWSPDGSRLAFVSFRDGNSEIYVVNADGSGLMNLTQDAGTDHSPAWSPDGSRIAFFTTREGYSRPYVMDADGSDPTLLPVGGAGPVSTSWSPDGSRIALTSHRHGNIDLYIVTVDGGVQTRVTDAPSHDTRPIWRP